MVWLIVAIVAGFSFLLEWRSTQSTQLYESERAAMIDFAKRNLPARDFEKTSQFYRPLGFLETWGAGWKPWGLDDPEARQSHGRILPHPELDPLASWFSCCLRLDELDAFYEICKSAGSPEGCLGQPRLHLPETRPWDGRLASFVDPDGTLMRLIQN